VKGANLRSPDRNTLDTDTIAAVATAPGMGGIGVVRISGPRSFAIARAMCGRVPEPRRAQFTTFRDPGGTALDNGIVLAFRGPRSFTGEDVVELQGHGGPVVLRLVLEAALAHGARLARAGEFTERAFLNGKLDLAQAEAVADLIASASEAAARGAMRSLQGQFSDAVHAVDDSILKLRVHVEAAMDFPEDEADLLTEGQVGLRIAGIREAVECLLRETRQGIILRDGISIALIGAPNVGKSSLMNRLAGEERAIVSPVPGTTRDLVPADLVLDGLCVRLVDTAGLRETLDPVEQEGVRRARDEAQRADLLLVLEDDRSAAPAGASALVAEIRARLEGIDPRRVIRVLNKADLSGREAGVASAIPLDGPGTAGAEVRVSALTGAGLDALRELIKARVGYAGEGTTFTARQRHLEALERVGAALARAGVLLPGRAAPELVAEELRAAHHALGTIVGEVSADELLGEIFATFCIGK
jgi:tRNA modification GTPase